MYYRQKSLGPTIDIYHQLVMCWANRGKVALPGLQASAQIHRLVGCTEEETVSPDHDASTARTVWMGSKDDIEHRYSRCDIIVAILDISF